MKQGKVLARYFPPFMLIVMAGILACVTVYNAGLLGGPWLFIAALLTGLALFVGMRQAHDVHEEVENALGKGRLSEEAVNFLGQPDERFTLASLAATQHEGIALLQNGRLVYVNPALAYMLGGRESDLVGSRLSRYINPEDASMLRLDDKGQTQPFSGLTRSTLRLSTNLGDMRWVICSVHKTVWEEKEAILLLFEDVDALKYTQQALEEQEQQSRILLERTPLGIAMFNSMGQINLANTAWRSAWGNFLPDTRRFNILQDPFMQDSDVERAVRQAFNKQEADIYNYEYHTSWGETRWLNLHFQPMLTPLDQLIGVAMVQQDITDLVRSQRRENELDDQLSLLQVELSAAEMRLGQLSDTSHSVLFCMESGGRIHVWNKKAEQRFNLTRGQVVGQHYKKFEAQLTSIVPSLGKALEEGRGEDSLMLRWSALGPHYDRLSPRFFARNDMLAVFIDDITVNLLAGRAYNLFGWAALEAVRSGTVFARRPVPPEGSPASLLLERAEAAIIASLGERVLLSTRLQQPELLLAVDSSIGQGLAEWAAILLAGAGEGRHSMDLTQGEDRGYGVFNLFCGNARPEALPMRELWQDGVVPSEAGSDGKLPCASLLDLATVEGIPGLYLGSRGGAGVTWRLPIVK